MKSLVMAAYPAAAWGLCCLSKQFADHHATATKRNERPEMLGGADFICRPNFVNGILDEELFTLSLPHIRLVHELPENRGLLDALFREKA